MEKFYPHIFTDNGLRAGSVFFSDNTSHTLEKLNPRLLPRVSTNMRLLSVTFDIFFGGVINFVTLIRPVFISVDRKICIKVR